MCLILFLYNEVILLSISAVAKCLSRTFKWFTGKKGKTNLSVMFTNKTCIYVHKKPPENILKIQQNVPCGSFYVN